MRPPSGSRAVLPAFWRSLPGGAAAFRPLFALVALASAAYLALLARAHEEPRRPEHDRGSEALAVSLVRDERRGLAASMNSVSFQLHQSAGPSMAGYLLDAGQFTLPSYVVAVLQAVYLAAYQRAFRAYEPPRRASGEGGNLAR